MSAGNAIKREILRSTSIIGMATIGALVIGMVRTKVFALILGPAGIGLFGVFMTIVTLGTAVAGMGVDSGAVRQLAAAGDRPEHARVARWAIWTFASPLAVLGAALVWATRVPIARLSTGSGDHADEVGWLALGIGASVIAATLVAQVQAARRMGDLARIRLWSALIAAVIGVAAVYLYGARGIVAAVLVAPLATCGMAVMFSRRLAKPLSGPFPGRRIVQEWRVLATVGTAVTCAAVIGSATQVAVRSIIAQRLGLADAGLFQASFAISSLNLGILLGAMVPEYYPRLSAAADRPSMVSDLFNHQMHVGLLLAAPAFFGISAAAPVLLNILYSSDFVGASLLLRFQITADALRVAGWSLGFVLLARQRSLFYILVEASLAAVFVPLTWASADDIGIAAAGAAYVLGYAASLAVALACAARDGIRITRSNALFLGGTALLLLATVGASLLSETLAEAVALISFTGAVFVTLRDLRRLGVKLPYRAQLHSSRSAKEG